MHDQRCADSTGPAAECRCSCHGRYHGTGAAGKLGRMPDVTSRTQADLDGRSSLSNGLRSKIAKTRASLPADRAGWSPAAAGGYATDPGGNTTVPAEWHTHLMSVVSVGRDVLAEHRAALGRDPHYQQLKTRLDEITAKHDEFVKASTKRRTKEQTAEQAADARFEAAGWASAAQQVMTERQAELAQYDQQRLVDALGSARPFGGRHLDVEVLTTGEGPDHKAARGDAAELLHKAEGFYPRGWLDQASAASTMRVGTSDRAFYQHSDRPYLALPAEGKYRSYAGGHGLGSAGGELDVTVHELGHRMEKTVPGLTQLEMAFVHARSTDPGGVVETPSRMAGYGASEVAYHDSWSQSYAGKTYGGADPGSAHWEVFQVGMQDTFSRQKRFDEHDDLQAFTLGALLTL